jgi:carboxylesterase type B
MYRQVPKRRAPSIHSLPPQFGTSDEGALHGSETPYVFGALSKGIEIFNVTKPVARAPVDYQVSAAMQEYWTQFAKTGNPNGGQLPTWPKFDASRRAYIEFASGGPVVKEGLPRERCDLFMENLATHCTTADTLRRDMQATHRARADRGSAQAIT